MLKYEFVNRDHRLAYVREAGAVRRFHSSPYMAKPQDVAQHTFNMLTMFLVLYPENWVDFEDKSLIMQAIVQHDLPERLTGDFPKPSKLSFIDRSKLHEFEYQLLVDLFKVDAMSHLSVENQMIVKSLDMLDLWFHCHEELNRGNNDPHLKNVLETVLEYVGENKDNIPERIYAIIINGCCLQVPELKHEYDMERDR